MHRLTLYALGCCVAFYALIYDMCAHLDGWRALEPFAFWIVCIVMGALATVLFPNKDDAP